MVVDSKENPNIRKIDNPNSDLLRKSMMQVNKLIEEERVRSLVAIVTYDDGDFDVIWSGLHTLAMHEKIGLLERMKFAMLSKSAMAMDDELL